MTVYESVDSFKAIGGLDKWASPFVVKGVQAPVRDRFEESRIRTPAEYFENMLAEKAATLVRAKCFVESGSDTQKTLKFLLDDERMVDLSQMSWPDDKQRRSVLGLRLVAQGPKLFCGFDFDDLSTIEVPVRGQQQCLLFRPSPEMQFLTDGSGALLTLEAMVSKVKGISVEDVAVLKEHAFVHTLGVAEALYTPSGWFAIMCSIGNSPCYSFSSAALLRHLKGDEDKTSLTCSLKSCNQARQLFLDACKVEQLKCTNDDSA